MVMGTTARHVKVALSMNIKIALRCQSEIDHHLRFAPDDNTLIFHLMRLAYIKHVCTTYTQSEILISFQVYTLVKYVANNYIPTMAPID